MIVKLKRTPTKATCVRVRKSTARRYVNVASARCFVEIGMFSWLRLRYNGSFRFTVTLECHTSLWFPFCTAHKPQWLESLTGLTDPMKLTLSHTLAHTHIRSPSTHGSAVYLGLHTAVLNDCGFSHVQRYLRRWTVSVKTVYKCRRERLQQLKVGRNARRNPTRVKESSYENGWKCIHMCSAQRRL